MTAILAALTALQVDLHESLRIMAQRAARGETITAADLRALGDRFEAISAKIQEGLVSLDDRVTALE